jgi:hypothetical protein
MGDCVPNTDPRRDTAKVQNDPATCSGLTKDPTWSTMYVTIAHNVWQYYGAANVIRRHYPQLKLYMTTLEARKNGTGLGQMFCNYGDWNPVVKTPCHITAALSFLHDVRRMADLAQAVGEAADAAMWVAKDEALTAEFHTPCEVPPPPWCAEGAQCQCIGLARFGAVGKNWTAWQALRGSFACSVATFGGDDPDFGVPKVCQCNATSGSDPAEGVSGPSGASGASGFIEERYGGDGGYRAAPGACKGQYGGFWDPRAKTYSSGSQMSVAAALWVGGIPEDGRQAPLLAALADEVGAKGKGLTVGFVGVQYMFEALVWANRTDAALGCLLRTPYPGYGHELYNAYEPATTLWESWTGDTMHQWLSESSRNHHYQAHINTILRKYIAGLSMPKAGEYGRGAVPGGGAWAVVRARPEAWAEAGIPSAAVSIDSHRGRVSVAWWRIDAGAGDAGSIGFGMNVTVPHGSAGELHVPMAAGGGTAVTLHDGTLLWARGAFQAGAAVAAGGRGVLGARREGAFVILDTTGGSFSLVAK